MTLIAAVTAAHPYWSGRNSQVTESRLIPASELSVTERAERWLRKDRLLVDRADDLIRDLFTALQAASVKAEAR